MSGRPKPTEMEDLRQLIREAHEAMKDLKIARKEIDQARAEHVGFLDETMRLAVAAAAEQIHNAAQQTLDVVQIEVRKVADHIAGILEAGSAEDLVHEIVSEAARNLAWQLELALDDDGQMVIRPKPGQVFVTTDPALAPPGSIILDAR